MIKSLPADAIFFVLILHFCLRSALSACSFNCTPCKNLTCSDCNKLSRGGNSGSFSEHMSMNVYEIYAFSSNCLGSMFLSSRKSTLPKHAGQPGIQHLVGGDTRSYVLKWAKVLTSTSYHIFKFFIQQAILVIHCELLPILSSCMSFLPGTKPDP